MGWFYPLFWSTLYKLTGVEHIIGVFQIIGYWTAVSIVALSSIRKNIYGYLIFFVFSFFPINLLFVCNITNNSLLFVFLLLAMAMYAVYVRNRERKPGWILVVCLILFLSAYFIRREAMFFIIPVMTYMSYRELFYGQRKMRSLLLSAVLTLSIFAVSNVTEKSLTRHIDGYYCFDSYQLAALVDITGMSGIKGELLWPDYIIKDEYLDDKPEIMKVLSSSYLYDDVTIFKEHHLQDYLKTENIYTVSMKPKDIVGIYVCNLRYYLIYRLKMVAQLTLRPLSPVQFSFYPGYVVSVKNERLMAFNNAVPGVFKMAGLYLVLLIAFGIYVIYDFKKNKRASDIFNMVVIASVLIVCMAIFAGAPSAQNRYLLPYLLLSMGVLAIYL